VKIDIEEGREYLDRLGDAGDAAKETGDQAGMERGPRGTPPDRRRGAAGGRLPRVAQGAGDDLYVGMWMPAFGGGGGFKGLIDELEFFHTPNQNAPKSSGALTSAQIQAIYNAGSSG
jgi:hypothetical protein